MIETIKFGSLKWYHILSPREDDFKFLVDTFHFHPLDIEDCRSDLNQRPKIDFYDDYYFLILHFPYFDRANIFLQTKEVKIFWGEDFLITIGNSHWVVKEMFNQAKLEAKEQKTFEVGTSDALLYKILERLMKETELVIRKIGDSVDLCGKSLFDKKAVHTIERLSFTRKNLITLNTMFKPQLTLFAKFESGVKQGYAENMENYWGNIIDYYQRLWDYIEDYDELIDGFSRTFDSLQTNRTNEIIKILTLISSILLPLTFIASLYGMNIPLPLQGQENSFFILFLGMTILAMGMVIFFKLRKWM
ncbi:MAG: magnesium transporter CorA family protein [Bacteroidetes bacterium]|nr:magnesium transporter CorA family protein [Bacteroidota bacterium]